MPDPGLEKKTKSLPVEYQILVIIGVRVSATGLLGDKGCRGLKHDTRNTVTSNFMKLNKT